MHVPTDVAAKAVEKEPAPQLVQLAAVDKPTPVKYVPAAQLLQVPDETAPKAVEYKPVPHVVHTLAADPVK